MPNTSRTAVGLVLSTVAYGRVDPRNPLLTRGHVRSMHGSADYEGVTQSSLKAADFGLPRGTQITVGDEANVEELRALSLD